MKLRKPSKPYPQFPLFYHQTGQWAKKVRGRTHYFGRDADVALAKWEKDRDYLMTGRTPPKDRDGCTVRDAANRFLSSKRALLNTSELSPRTWRGYYTTAANLVRVFGKTRLLEDLDGRDFEQLRGELAKTRGAVALGNEIQRVRSIFGFAFKDGMIDRPVRYGASFAKPSRKAIRQARNAAGERMIEADVLRKIIDQAGTPMRAMILLGLNCAFGQHDVSSLPSDAIDLERGWINFPRPKTATRRRCPLWPETVAALREAIEARPDPRDPADDRLAFLTRYGQPWVRMRDRGKDKPATPIDSLQLKWRGLLESIGVPHEPFYSLRRIHLTIADGAKDHVAAAAIMGHIDNSMASHYRERIADDRLEAVVKVVRDWLWPEKE